MRRPGTWLLVILALGILLLSRSERTEESIFRRTALRRSLKESENEICTLEGRVVQKSLTENGVRLTLYAGRDAGLVRLYFDDPDTAPGIGCRIRVRGIPALFKKADDPGAFSMRAYADAVGLSCSLRPERTEVLDASVFPLSEAVFRFRRRLSGTVLALSPEGEAAALQALLPGGLPAEEEFLERESSFTRGIPGLSYLFRFSGAHISFTGFIVLRLSIKKLKNRRLSCLLSFLSALAAAALSGFSLSAMRALLLLVLRLSCTLLNRRFDLLHAGSLVLILFLLVRPALLFTPAVASYLPVLCAFGLLYPELSRLLPERRKRFSIFLSPAASAPFLLPATLLREYAVSPFSWFFGLVLYPLSRGSYVLTLIGAVMGMRLPRAGAFLLFLSSRLLSLSEKIGTGLLKLPFSVLANGYPGTLKTVVYYGLLLGMVLLMMQHNLRIEAGRSGGLFHCGGKTPVRPLVRLLQRGRLFPVILCLLFLAGLLFLRAPKVGKDETEIVFLSVGQGDGILIRQRERTFMIDGGSSDDPDLAENILRPALLYYGIRRLDLIFLTHGDSDHISGTLPLIASGFPAGEVLLPDTAFAAEEFGAVLETVKEKKIAAVFLHRGAELDAGNFRIRCLHPAEKEEVRGNASSLVLLFESGGFRALFTGDIGEEQEQKLDGLGPVSVLKTAHHGSRFSTSEAFLSAVRPALAVISAGKDNPYGHPSEETLLRLYESGARTLCTKDCGAVTVRVLKDGSFRVKCFDNSSD